MTRKQPFGVFIGRFQPWHSGHQSVALEALESVEKLIIVIGSSYAARDPKNPFTFEERKRFITKSLGDAGINPNCIKIVGVRDYFYNENAWIEAVRREVKTFTRGSAPLLFGHRKDSSSYYLMSFPDWKFRMTHVFSDGEEWLSATEIREAMFETKHLELIGHNTTDAVVEFIREFIDTKEFEALAEWHRYNIHYPEELKRYPINVVTVDSVVFKSGHVLAVRRGKGNGVGLIALPGGHLEQHEEPLAGAIRELREETGLKIMESILVDNHRGEKIFAYPGRSLRARVITIAEHFDLGHGTLPDVKGGDDADDAFWLPLEDVMMHPEWFFEDHWSIIFHFYSKGGY